MIPGAFEYYAPRSLTDAVKFLAEHKDDVKILSDGQSLLPLMKMRLSKPSFIVDIGRIPDLDMISEDGDSLIMDPPRPPSAALQSAHARGVDAFASRPGSAGSRLRRPRPPAPERPGSEPFGVSSWPRLLY
jgi:hypothetical protein